MNIDQSAMRYSLMDSSRHALQTFESLFKFWNHFFNQLPIFKNNNSVGFAHMRGGGGICADYEACVPVIKREIIFPQGPEHKI